MLEEITKTARQFNALIGLTKQDFLARNARLSELLALWGVSFRPPGDSGAQPLKGSASLCANFAWFTVFQYPALAKSLFEPSRIPNEMRVHCTARPDFPLQLAFPAVEAYQSRLAFHAVATSAGEKYRPSELGLASFKLFFEDMLVSQISTVLRNCVAMWRGD